MDFEDFASGSVKGLLGSQSLKKLLRELWVKLQTGGWKGTGHY